MITSKILSIHQWLCIPIGSISKDELVKKETDIIIPKEEVPWNFTLTIKYNTLIASAWIDESNANWYYVLWPKNPEKEAKEICNYLKNKFSIKDLAIIITDSHIIPMRLWTMWISIWFYWLEVVKNYIWKEDIFWRKLEVSRANIVDSLAVMWVVAMWEWSEQQPICIIRDATFVEFTNRETYKESLIPIKEDIYYPILKRFLEK